MPRRRNAQLTFQGNRDAGRHAWLRLTPAYSVRLVREYLAAVAPNQVVTDPFSGTGTTALAAAELGLRAQALDINPFLVWLGTVKTRDYPPAVRAAIAERAIHVVEEAGHLAADGQPLWQPELANIDRWWSTRTRHALSALRRAIDEVTDELPRDLLDVAFCRTLIGASRAAFNHQSMSLRPTPAGRADGEPDRLFAAYREDLATVLAGAAIAVPGSARLWSADARDLHADGLVECDLLITSPPYANRMSYIRELRPYMYWLRFLTRARDAAELDWAAIGGTWGTATSRLATCTAVAPPPIRDELETVCRRIATGGSSASLLAAYVTRYASDVWAHLQAAYHHVRPGGQVVYIVGNSSFYGHVVPVQLWYQRMLQAAGFGQVRVTQVRKRNSNSALYEYAVTATRR